MRVLVAALAMLSWATWPTIASPTAWQLINDGDPNIGTGTVVYFASTGTALRVENGAHGSAGPAYVWELVGEDWKRVFVSGPSPNQIGGACTAYDSDRNRLVLFGAGTSKDQVWEYDGASWSQRTFATSPIGRSKCRMTYDSDNQVMVFFGGYSSGFSGLPDTWEYDGSSWTQVVTSPSPSPRGDVSLTFADDLGAVLLFGGRHGDTVFNDTWYYDARRNRWILKAPATAPSRRAGAGLAYDPSRQRSVLFGGLTLLGMSDETWEWTGQNWAPAGPTTAPLPRWRINLWWDAARGKIVGQGGAPDNGGYNDTWEYAPATWSQIALSGQPRPRYRFAMAYDPAQDVVVLYGGYTAHPNPGAHDTWHLVDGVWTLQPGAGEPTAMYGFDLTFVSSRLRLEGFSGNDTSGTTVLDDLHQYDAAAAVWSDAPTCCPNPRSDHGWADAPAAGGTLLFGGWACCIAGTGRYLAADTWILDADQEWMQVETSAGPSARMSPALAYDSVRSRVVLYGGTTTPGGVVGRDDTWAFLGGVWQKLIEPSAPGPRKGASLVYDPVRDAMVLFGDGPIGESVTWEFNGTDWISRSTPFHPAPERCWAPMTYDSKREVVWLFGGQDCRSEIHRNDTWAYGADPDGDGRVGGLDNCRVMANVDQGNQDGDPAGDACDCAVSDPGSFVAPFEVTSVRVEGATVSWADQAPLIGPAVRYDVVTGDLSTLRSTGTFANASCLASDLSSASYTDTRIPLQGDGFYYMTRATNVCGVGTYGSAALDSGGICP